MITDKKLLIRIASIACFAGCIGDFLAMFVLGNYFPGYSQLFDTMSSLGVAASPVSDIISTWWIILGFLIILFAFGFRKAFVPYNKYVRVAVWLIVLYGLGEGLGSGIFRAEHVNNSLTTSAIIHELLGGIGIFAILILPLVMKKIVNTNPGFHTLSSIVFFVGLVLLALFSFRLFLSESNALAQYKGLWQRLFMLNYYFYLMVIATLMIKKQRSETE